MFESVIHNNTFLSNEKNFTIRYKGYAPQATNFGRIDISFGTPEWVGADQV
jgi:hypothetical protein